MTHEPRKKEGRKAGDRPFPWRCPKCLRKEVYPERMAYKTEAAHDGRTYEIDLPEMEIPRCRSCGELVFTSREDDAITRALRLRLHLLLPEQIRSRRESLGLDQKELAKRLGVAKETISRWETGALIQSRAMDNLLRVYFAFPEVQAALCGAEQDPSLGHR